MKRFARRTALLLAVVLLGTAAILSWFALSQTGLRFAWRAAQGLLPGTVSVGSVEGRLVGPLVLGAIEVEVAGFSLRVRRAEVEWSPGSLARGRLDIEALRLIGFELTAPAETAAEESAAPLELPEEFRPSLDIAIAEFSIDGGTLRAVPDVSIWSFERLSLGVRLDERLEFSDIVVRSAQFDLDGRFGMSSRSEYAIDASLDWVLRLADLPDLAGATRLSGTAASLTLDQTLAPPYGVAADITVDQPLTDARLAGEVMLDSALNAFGRDLPLERLSGNIGIDGGLDALTLTGTLSSAAAELGDVSADFEALYGGDVIDIVALRLRSLDNGARFELAGRIAVGAEPDVALAGTWTDLRWPLSGTAAAVSPSGRLELSGTVSELRAELAAAIADGTVEGNVTRRGEVLEANFSWAGLSWQRGERRIGSESGELQVEGRLDEFRLTLDAALAADPGTGGHLRAAGRGDRNGLDLEQIDIAVLDGTVAGSAAASWDSGFTVRAELSLTNVDPGLIAPAWPGRIDGRVAASVVQAGGASSLSVSAANLTGTLRERPMALTLQGSYQAPLSASVDAFELQLGDTSLTAQGDIGADLAFEWRLDSPRLDDLWPGLVGALSTTGRIQGPRAEPRIAIDATGSGLAIQGYRAAAVELRARIDASGRTDSELELEIGEASVADRDIGRLTLTGAGNAARHALQAKIEAGLGSAELALTGQLETAPASSPAWSFDLSQANVELAAGTWSLRRPASGRIADDGAQLQRACWQNVEASLCLAGTYSPERTAASFVLDDLPLEPFAGYLPAGAVVRGTIDGAGELELASDAMSPFDLEFATSEAWIGTGDPESDAGLWFAPGSARASLKGETLAVELELPLATADGGIEIEAAVRGALDQAMTDSTLEGSVTVAIPDMGFVAALTREVADAAGSLAADLRLSGTVEAPRLGGRIDFSDGTARLPTPGIVLENVTAEVSTNGDETLNLAASARSGTGRLDATGSLRFAGNLPVGEIALQGDAFEIIGTPTLRVLASPDLSLELTPDRAVMSGNLFVPTARITPPDFSENVARVTPDEIIVDMDQPRSATLLRPLYVSVGLELGDDVTFDGLGLAGRLAGALQITETPNEPASGSGELRIERGTYEAYSQTLDIRTGRLVFAGGALMRPGIDIEAVREPTDNILVGARVRGTLDRPELTVFSEPAMPREEQLSYLLLGRPLGQASADESSGLSQAAFILGLSGGNALSERINRSLGFDEFGIRTEPGEASTAASFVVGRYLAPSLYVSYGIGLYDQVNTLRLRYEITGRWRLETQSSAERSGGDVVFRFERGQ